MVFLIGILKMHEEKENTRRYDVSDKRPLCVLRKFIHDGNGKLYFELTALGYVKNFIREQNRIHWYDSVYGHTMYVDEHLYTILGLRY
jgi:hypothetical protein